MNLSRRNFLKAGLASGALFLAACSTAPSGPADGGSGGAGSEAVPDQLMPTEGMDFIVGFDQDYRPYGYVGDNGEFTGFDLDLAKRVCELRSWNYIPQPINWDAKDGELNGGSITCIWNGFTYEQREDDYTWTPVYMENAQVFAVKADSGISTFDDLAGKVVETQVDSSGLAVLTSDYPDLVESFASLETRAEYGTCFMELESGACDAVACDLSVAAYQIAAKPDVFVMLEDRLNSEHYAVGFKKGNTELAAAVTESLRQMDADGEVEALCEAYADQGISYAGWCLE